MKISIIGTGYVGLTTAVALSYIGHEVKCIEQNKKVVEHLVNGHVPIHEPGIKELLAMNLPISFGGWDSYDTTSDVIFIAVGTPCKSNGDADLTYVEAVATEIGKRVEEKPHLTVVVKSTVPLGTSRRVESIITANLRDRCINTRLSVASNPEFLREGIALYDTLYPDRIVVGANENFAINTLRELYTPILEQTFKPPISIPRPQGDKLPVFLTTTPTCKRYPKSEPKKAKTLAKKWTTLPDQSPIIESAEINIGGSRSDQSGPISAYQTIVFGGRDVSKSHRQTIRNITQYGSTLL